MGAYKEDEDFTTQFFIFAFFAILYYLFRKDAR
jgi:hypothetical protein